MAILVSLLVHFFGVTAAFRTPPDQSDTGAASDSVALGQAFEDMAEAPSDPVPPEPAPVPPVEDAPEPAPPTTLALVASDDPRDTKTPDLGVAKEVQPDTVEPSAPKTSDVPEPEALEPVGSEATATAEAAVVPPVESAAAAEPLETPEDGSEDPVEAGPLAPAPSPSSARAPAPTADAPQQVAAVPEQVSPTLPVTPAPTPSVVPVVPTESEAVDSALPTTMAQPTPEIMETTPDDGEIGGSDLAVSSSMRPKAPTRRPAAQFTPQGGSGSAPRVVIESPLTTYQRERTLSGGSLGGGSRQSGNASVTNYAGQVLVHLNNMPKVRNHARGTAMVTFEINLDGSLAWVTVSRSTGTLELDSEARAQIRRAAPFPRPPKGANRRITFTYLAN
ncbi:energy transducer TonB [Tropicimonas sp. IMCC34043]|uniref:energy transducer TonB family protein n=1 Tax=Tropicimonas sp. IMCC34043 TaxID=2248760 RepID=UPI0018E57704|nr:energy transducer TonB [Tropicimonas sp. IMCC34043]